MTAPLQQFTFPVRSSDVWGLNQQEHRPQEDIAADLDFQDNAIEDYLNTIVPNTYIQMSSVGSGTIDPAQLATGTATAGTAPVSNGTNPVWTDIATQAELNAVAATITPHPFGASDIQRGTVGWTMGVLDTNTLTTVIFSAVFSSVPVVVLSLTNLGRLNLASELTAVTTAQFTARVYPSAGTALGVSSGSINWVAIKA